MREEYDFSQSVPNPYAKKLQLKWFQHRFLAIGKRILCALKSPSHN